MRDVAIDVLHAISDAILAVDDRGQLVFVNAAAVAMWGLSSVEEMLALPAPQLMARFEIFDEHDGRQLTIDDLPGAQALSGRVSQGLFRLRRRASASADDDRWIQIRATPALGPGGQVRYAVSVFHDQTDQTRSTHENQRLRAEVEESLRSREDLLAIVSHDLRNPLGVILTSSRLLLRAPLPPDKGDRARRQVEAIQRAGNRMNRLIRDLLDLASIQAGQLVITRRAHDAAGLMSEAVESLQPLAVQKSQRLTAELPGRELTVSCERERVIQVFAQLVGNAIKFGPEGGEIRVSVRTEGPTVCFSVADDGPGMAAEELQHLYDRAWQAKRKNREGIGLGLSLVKGIVDSHGGRVWAESALGTGTTVHFTLEPTPPASPSA